MDDTVSLYIAARRERARTIARLLRAAVGFIFRNKERSHAAGSHCAA